MDKSKVHIKHGLWIALIVICISVIVNIFGLYKIDAVSYSMYVVIIVLLIIFCFQYKNLNRSTAGFANIFAHGFKTACVTALIIIIWNLLSAKIIFKDPIEHFLIDIVEILSGNV